MNSQIVPDEERMQSMQGAPDRWPIEAHAFIISFAAMLITKTEFDAGTVIAETAKFMDTGACFPEELAVNLRKGMTQQNWPAMLSSVIQFMHRDARNNPQDADFLARLNDHILEEIRKMNA